MNLDTIDTNESLPTCQFHALSYHTQRGPTHEVMILVLQSGHSWLVAMINSEQSTRQSSFSRSSLIRDSRWHIARCLYVSDWLETDQETHPQSTTAKVASSSWHTTHNPRSISGIGPVGTCALSVTCAWESSPLAAAAAAAESPWASRSSSYLCLSRRLRSAVMSSATRPINSCLLISFEPPSQLMNLLFKHLFEIHFYVILI